MRRIILATVVTFITTHAFAYGTVLCHSLATDIDCVTVENALRASDSAIAANQACKARYPTAGEDFCNISSSVIWQHFQNACVAVFTNSQQKPFLAVEQAALNAIATALTRCISSSREERRGSDCKRVALACDGNGIPLISSAPAPAVAAVAKPAPIAIETTSSQPSPSFHTIAQYQFSDLLDLTAVRSGISFGIGIIIALLAFAKRAAIINFLIHGNLPPKLPVYGEDIQCLFKRTQRINWYGRVVFGIVVNLAMTHQQLIDLRKYWLGRVIAFDSLRRQRQNQLATMHMQLAAKAKSDAHDKKKFWSRRWATLRSLFKKLFWVIIALFNLVMALFFIRVNIARLVRGAIVESKDLTLILQAKEAIEESTTYLKEYLITANTFDGGDEIYEPK
jgi:hypothetical protein